MTADPLVSMVIVNYNAGDYLRRCLESVAEQTYQHWELIIVDNNSQDESLAAAQGFDHITVVRNDENRGFAAGQNQGMRLAEGDCLMPLNFDIKMTPSFLREMVQGLEPDSRVGSVCGKLLRMTRSWEPTNEIDSTGLTMSRTYVPRSRGHGEVDRGQFDHDRQVFGAQGAAPLYRREMLEDIAFDGQFFDESYFMWYEDVDLDWRAWLRGWECRYVPTAVAYHLGPTVPRTEPEYVSTTVRNRWLTILSNAGSRELIAHWRPRLGYELSLLRYVLSAGLWRSYLVAVKDLIFALPRTIEKRRWVQSRAASVNTGGL